MRKPKRHITKNNAQELQRRSWDARRANKAMRDILLPLGLWDTANGRPSARRMHQVLDAKDRLDHGYARALVRQHWPQIEGIIEDALYNGNTKQAMWACDVLLPWLKTR